MAVALYPDLEEPWLAIGGRRWDVWLLGYHHVVATFTRYRANHTPVDSFGALYSEQVHFLVQKYLHFCKASGKEVGVHMHNNQHLAYANTIEGIIEGANYLDATMAGLGRGAGNCQMELLLAFLEVVERAGTGLAFPTRTVELVGERKG